MAFSDKYDLLPSPNRLLQLNFAQVSQGAWEVKVVYSSASRRGTKERNKGEFQISSERLRPHIFWDINVISVLFLAVFVVLLFTVAP